MGSASERGGRARARAFALVAWGAALSAIACQTPEVYHEAPSEKGRPTIDPVGPVLPPPPPLEPLGQAESLDELMGKDETLVDVLRPGDVLSVNVRDEPELSLTKARVSRDGMLRLPWVGKIDVNGKTRSQVERELSDHLQAEFVRHADVTIELLPEECRKVYVLGRVMRPGTLALPVDRRLTLLQVIALAGGLATAKLDLEADASSIQLIRVINKKRRQFTLSFEQILDRQQLDRDIFIDPDDIVYVPPKKELYVFGSVLRPGPFPLNAGSRLSIDEALSLAGGFAPTAERDRVTLIRRAASGGAASYQVDMKNEAQRATTQVTANDTVIVADRQVRRIYVLGQVERPGSFELDERGLTVIKALALAGGWKRIGAANYTMLIRRGKQWRVQVNTIIDTNKLEDDPQLSPGDIIYVPESFF